MSDSAVYPYVESGERIMVTRNSEYHLRGVTCVGVRTKEGDWHTEHQAIGGVLEGAFGHDTQGIFRATPGPHPHIGQRLCFSGDVLTSPLKNIREVA